MIDLTYYIYASLPPLARGQRPPMTMPEFRTSCDLLLAEPERDLLDAADLFQRQPRKTDLPILNRWYEREHALRNELAVMRAQRKGVDATPYLRPARHDPHAAEIAAEVFVIESPREAENRLDDYRWDYLDELEFGHDFNFARLVIYNLKLQLLQRRAQFDEVAGRKWLNNRRQRVEELTRFAIHEFDELDEQ